MARLTDDNEERRRSVVAIPHIPGLPRNLRRDRTWREEHTSIVSKAKWWGMQMNPKSNYYNLCDIVLFTAQLTICVTS